MFALKKLLVAAGIALGMLSPAFAFAETNATDVVGQIQTLQQKINALQLQKQETVATLVTMLKEGSAGDQVSILQALLAADPEIYPEGVVSGYFGKLTAQAVKRFQQKNGLDQVGFVGPRTLEKLQGKLKERPLVFSEASTTASSTLNRGQMRKLCAYVPAGHAVAAGWQKKMGGAPVIPECQKLPKGIMDVLAKRGSASSTPGTDTTAPKIARVAVTGVSSTTATVKWTTNERATGAVFYTATSTVDLATATSVGTTSLTTSHSLSLSGLAASTMYFYVLESEDASGNTATTSARSFTTSND
jgi:peptidoglycan hydrolase-like protein with peptidoglycan-binding domain